MILLPTPSQYCKARGIKVKKVIKEINVPRSTFYRWFKTKPELFRTIISGAIQQKRYKHIMQIIKD